MSTTEPVVTPEDVAADNDRLIAGLQEIVSRKFWPRRALVRRAKKLLAGRSSRIVATLQHKLAEAEARTREAEQRIAALEAELKQVRENSRIHFETGVGWMKKYDDLEAEVRGLRVKEESNDWAREQLSRLLGAPLWNLTTLVGCMPGVFADRDAMAHVLRRVGDKLAAEDAVDPALLTRAMEAAARAVTPAPEGGE